MPIRILRIGPDAAVPTGLGDDAHIVVLPATPDRSELDPELEAAAAHGVVVAADVAGLNAVVTRLHRTELLAEVPIGWLPARSALAQTLATAVGLPGTPAELWRIATTGTARRLPLVRDDHGGITLCSAELAGWEPGTVGAQAYHDTEQVADGDILGVRVWPAYAERADEVGAEVRRRGRFGLTRRRRSLGRAMQVASADARVTIDGVEHPRPVRWWTWYADDRAHWYLRLP